MAFGFGFNKQKVLSAAEKFVQQGKLQNAIAEYEKVLKADPKDLTVMNTVGDLYSRLGNTDKAVECFKSVGDAYATQGFTVKAIAMYKKLSKIKHSFEGVLRLAELYTQQGLFNDARSQYLQVAEEFLRSGELEQAVKIFQKTLEMDPDNVAMRSKLAEVYVRLGKKSEAWQIFAAAAETLRARGQLEGAETILTRMLTLDPGNSYALLLRGRTAVDSGDVVGAIQYLEKVADLDNHPEGMTALLDAYVRGGRFPEARVLAGKLLSVHNDAAGLSRYADALMASGHFEEALQIYGEYSDSFLASDPAKILDNLHSIISHVRENAASLEMILALFAKAGENSHLTEVYELLAHAYVQSGDLDKARDYYLKLTQLEPQNQLHARNYQQIVGKLGGAAAPRLISAEEGSILIEELETTAPFIDQIYADDVALAVRAALTDAELFISYNMPDKALAPLLGELPKAPRDLRLNQRLAALHNRGERFAEAAICCRTLESIYHDAGYPEEATRYGELAARYEERAGASNQASSTLPKVVVPEIAPAVQVAQAGSSNESNTPVAAEPESSGLFFHAPAADIPATSEVTAPEFELGPAQVAESEIDLSGEWDGAVPAETTPDLATATTEGDLIHSEPAAATIPTVPIDDQPTPQANAEPADRNTGLVTETIEEIRFYLANSMIELAHAALEKLQELNPDPATVSLMRAEIESTAVAEAPAETADEVSVEVVGSYPEAQIEETIPAHSEDLQAQSFAVAETVAPDAPPIQVDAPIELPAVVHADVSAGPADLAADVSVHSESHLESSPVHEVLVAPTAPLVTNDEQSEPALVPQHEAVAYVPEAATSDAVSNNFDAPTEPENETPHVPVPAVPERIDTLAGIVSELEASLGDSFLEKPPAAVAQAGASTETRPVKSQVDQPVAPSPALAPAAMAAAAPGSLSAPWKSSTEFTTFARPPISNQAPPVEEPPASLTAVSSAGIDLATMFGDLKHELEEDAANSDEDPETHYSLGVAFREMGLLDEAIGELQKVCQTVEHGHPFPQILQTYTWLAQCFLDKGLPEAALRWYERALTLPTLDSETRMALHYELACAYETAGNKSSALHYFMEVYGSNIDYRDVGERIKAVKS
jgi:tetratricopeptide (TPR) repeat protein